MPTLSWNEIRHRAVQFSREWQDASDERAEAQTFWNDFFEVFGIKRRTVAIFEERVRSLKNTYHRIDLLYKGIMLAEHKSGGESLDKAESQAFQYIQELAASNRNDDIPRYIVLSNFHEIALYDLEPEGQREIPYERLDFSLKDLNRYVEKFAFIIGQKTHRFGEEDPTNLKAAQLMADLHDSIKEGNYTGAQLERLLVRILFCLFAEDTGIFEPAQFELFIENHTKEDGSNLGVQLNFLFEVLDTLIEKRPTHWDEDLAAFPYINGQLFAERLPTAGFNREMRDRLLDTCRFDWSRISPAICGSLFQGIMDDRERRQIGAHYTSERDILKVIRPLFLDALQDEFEQIKKDRSTRRAARLGEFQNKLPTLQFLDPACGCGNFLVIAYRELRRLELEVLKLIYNFDRRGKELNLGEVAKLSNVDVDQFYGIEIGAWPARIAETALWLTDHQMNIELSLVAGNLFQRIPLRTTPHIRCANALSFDWNDLLPAYKCSYVLGNPPFVGKKARNNIQQQDTRRIFRNESGTGVLDYVTCWYVKAGEYIAGHNIPCAFVSTNSISQGEQPGILWSILCARFGFKIHFAHRTFSWISEAHGAAHVHVVIIGFSDYDQEHKFIYDYEQNEDEPIRQRVSNINPYLVEGSDVVISARTNPLAEVPSMSFGNMPNENGHLILNEEERETLLEASPEAACFIRPLISAKEYLHNIERWCIWLKDVSPERHRGIKELRERIEAVREYRLASKRIATNRLADVPYLFGEIRQPSSDYLLIPCHSSEKRNYIPISYFGPENITHNSCVFMPKATLYHFGILSSAMHMAWVRIICGRIKSDFRYSAKLVFNNYPWPIEVTDTQRIHVEECSKTMLDIRQGYLEEDATLADLYDPLYMPADLLRAHKALDRAVDRCYQRKTFESERERVQYLFQLYETLTAPPSVT